MIRFISARGMQLQLVGLYITDLCYIIFYRGIYRRRVSVCLSHPVLYHNGKLWITQTTPHISQALEFSLAKDLVEIQTGHP